MTGEADGLNRAYLLTLSLRWPHRAFRQAGFMEAPPLKKSWRKGEKPGPGASPVNAPGPRWQSFDGQACSALGRLSVGKRVAVETGQECIIRRPRLVLG